MTTTDAAARPKGFGLLKAAFTDRRTLAMLLLGFSAGLPYVLITGTLNAWLSAAEVTASTIGVLSWVGLAYAFKFLWSPAMTSTLPIIGKLGRRRGWMVTLQVIIGLALFVVAASHPEAPGGVAAMAAAAAFAAFASASQDIVIDAWRIEVAGDVAPIDLLSSIYQFGYRVAGLAGAAGALLLAAAIGWPGVYIVGGVLMGLGLIGSLIAPEPDPVQQQAVLKERRGSDRLRNFSLIAVLIGWAWAAYQIITFMVRALTEAEPPSAGEFTSSMGPWVIGVTVLLPCVLAAFISRQPTTEAATGSSVLDTLYDRILAPLTELMGRLKWAAVLVLALILSYRLADSIWGSFAYPFYMGAEGGALGHTLVEVALASKTFGVIVTILGIALGGWMLLAFGRMATLMLGAILAASTNLLFADLAMGAPVIGGFMQVTGLYGLFGAFGVGEPLARLMLAITGENLASGIAGTAFVAYLSALSSRMFGAVQFAIFTSLALLIGTLGRAPLGEMIDQQGFAPMFALAAWLGCIAIAFCALEWIREARSSRALPGDQGGPTDAAT
ncbi:AmpG family muropeptide MFS transporter [Brevundimonas aveniformis]|uniref:AmpG family muropeptide MFS transporter n=1 Tax=Brevundimonas aveniformis TaxID=370977 RepID=UPI00248F8556|nr:beta-lactamase induction signal transducer [Brevundimonas aveniformis]